MALIRDIIDRVLFPNREVHPIPVLDGAFSPNNRLDQARVLGEAIDRPDDLIDGPDQALYVSSGRHVLRCTGADFAQRDIFVTTDDLAGPLAFSNDGKLLVGVAGQGVLAFDAAGQCVGALNAVAGVPLACPTALTVASDGTVFITDGSRVHRAADWLPDLLMRNPPSGRLVACDASLGNARVLADALDWPSGVAFDIRSGELWLAEAWAHRLTARTADGALRRVVVKNFAGYPARVTSDPQGGGWMAFFGMRTQLIEFVLRERAFCEAMMASVPRELWIGPSLENRFDYREPTQIGHIKKLGIQKPWAPPRSYGLIARLDDQGEPVSSLHSRVEGRMHGITAVRCVGARVLALAKARDLLIELPMGQA